MIRLDIFLDMKLQFKGVLNFAASPPFRSSMQSSFSAINWELEQLGSDPSMFWRFWFATLL